MAVLNILDLYVQYIQLFFSGVVLVRFDSPFFKAAI